MMFPAFSKEETLRRLSTLLPIGQRAFGLLCCERMLPNYVAFQAETNGGDSIPLREAMEMAWESIESRADDSRVRRLSEMCEFVAPNSEQFVSRFTTPAQDACFAICCVLDHILKPDPERIAQVATFATDSIDLYVQEIEAIQPNAPNLEELILAHPLMQRELARQDQDFSNVQVALSDRQSVASRLLALRHMAKRGDGSLKL